MAMQEDDIKPQIDIKDVPKIASHIFGLTVDKVAELNSYDDRNYHILASSSSNANIQNLSPLGYVFKVTNSADSKDLEFFDGQNELLLLLQRKNLAAPVPVKNVAGNYYSVEQLPYGDQTRAHVVRLFEFQPGKILKSVPASFDLYYQVGVWCGSLNEALKNLQHPGIDNRTVLWNFKRAGEVKSYLHHVKDDTRNALVGQVIDAFLKHIYPIMNDLEQGPIHGDLNEQNILVTSNDDVNWNISSVLDFNDVNKSCYLFDIGTAICYVMLEARRNGLNIFDAAAQALAGYTSVRSLNQLEMSLLKERYTKADNRTMLDQDMLLSSPKLQWRIKIIP